VYACSGKSCKFLQAGHERQRSAAIDHPSRQCKRNRGFSRVRAKPAEAESACSAQALYPSLPQILPRTRGLRSATMVATEDQQSVEVAQLARPPFLPKSCTEYRSGLSLDFVGQPYLAAVRDKREAGSVRRPGGLEVGEHVIREPGGACQSRDRRSERSSAVPSTNQSGSRSRPEPGALFRSRRAMSY
jgi:hypothetical protein